MDLINSHPNNLSGADESSRLERLHGAAQQDFTPHAIDAALHIAMTTMTTARCMLVRGDLSASLIAAREAGRAVSAAVDSLSMLVR